MSDMRVVNTEDLLFLCRVADAYEFNRRADTERLSNVLDPEGVHLLSMRLFDHTRSGEPRRTQKGLRARKSALVALGLEPSMGDPMHHRVAGLLKVKGTMEPREVILDVPHDMWEKLHTSEDYNRVVEQAKAADNPETKK